MIITIEATPKEVAEVVQALQPVTLYTPGIEKLLQENPDYFKEEAAKAPDALP